MKFVTVSGPPSSGKTSVILKVIECMRNSVEKVGVVKFDCLTTYDDILYKKAGVEVMVGLSGNLCPDHFYISNIDDCVKYGTERGFDLLISESAGLCNRCSPHIKEVLAVCVIDSLSGINTPKKIGPMLKFADIIVITKGDIVSQAEREVFTYMVRETNPGAKLLYVNGLTGQGAYELSSCILEAASTNTLDGKKLRFTMPAALCSYCLGETLIGEDYQMGNTKKIPFQQTRNSVEKTWKDFEETDQEDRQEPACIDSLTIIGGQDKSGEKENVKLTIQAGEVICIVGPTGSGKSRLLEDIECMAKGDTPSKRKIEIEGRHLEESRLVAQLSQNMNFVMDASVCDFIKMHARSRKITQMEEVTEKIIQCANELAGEKFTGNTAVTQLSGGQSRALMIADVAFLSSSPIVLIDELENAGVDRGRALELLVQKGKIVLVSTHDPILALLGDKRIIINNGAINQVIETELAEKENLKIMRQMDNKMLALREAIRKGEKIGWNMSDYFVLNEFEKEGNL
ncbi:ATP-binding cassette domain-containing protein [Anaeromicropila populeti]|uniref:Ni2+-binding GTPase involved in regulation of expression and maturation of urease and hydrogenase n=1 Tax=Anaeromicropila populeti TaxID=37658 RepID=A0A1I6IM91_9FIRM|nr:ATP-binding cassette domain-containing protein [Anaeromicropila populeti]SFR67833.1 Ni2+-binding GTPase involved in regulation of expression and maturation of urease and hydrogenase [Anaeromicropila populeti]